MASFGQQAGQFLLGTPQQTQQLPISSPEQLQTRQGLRQQGLQQIQQNPLSFAPQRAQYEKHFNEQIIPTLAERFQGNLRSSAYKSAMPNTASDFQAKLAALESQYNLGANQQGLQQILATLGPEFENIVHTRQPGFLENLGTAAAQGAGAYATGGLGGGATDILSLLKQLFGGGGQQQQPYEFNAPQGGIQPSQGNAVGSQQLINLFSQVFGGR